jgi:hypothetical protein
VHLLGSLLLLLDRRLGSPIRERVVVAYFRLKGGVQVRSLGQASIASCRTTETAQLDVKHHRMPLHSCDASVIAESGDESRAPISGIV